MAEPWFEFGTQWRSRCFLCGAVSPKYRTDDRLCKECVDRYRKVRFFDDVHDLKECFVTVLPDIEGFPYQALRRQFSDVLLGSGRTLSDPADLFAGVFPNRPSLPCGQPVLFEAEPLARFAGLGNVQVLDLSLYLWSGTLKDLRSWAVLAVAIEKNIRDLAVWTAGNAGYSLAKIVHRWNAMQPDERQRKIVHCLVDTTAPPEVVVTLRSLQSRVAPISTGSGAILSRDQVYHVVASLGELDDGYWQVTDGWDGVGVFMYSLLARQSLFGLRAALEDARFEPDMTYVVAPLGTGNLLLGFIRGMENHAVGNRHKLVAALPFGDNMMTPFLFGGTNTDSRVRMRRVEPVAPKLTGFYTPLSPCLWHLAQNRDFSDTRSVDFLEVDLAAQIEAAARIFALPAGKAIACEPSALIAFGSLKQLSQRIRDYGGHPERCAALVVNSGFGIMGIDEQRFYTESIFAFR